MKGRSLSISLVNEGAQLDALPKNMPVFPLTSGERQHSYNAGWFQPMPTELNRNRGGGLEGIFVPLLSEGCDVELMQVHSSYT